MDDARPIHTARHPVRSSTGSTIDLSAPDTQSSRTISDQTIPTFELSVSVLFLSGRAGRCKLPWRDPSCREGRACGRRLTRAHLLTHRTAGLPQTKAKPLWFWLKTAKWDFDGDSLAYSTVNCRLGISCFPMPPWEVLHEYIPQDGLAHGLMALVTPDYKKGGPQAVPNESITASLESGSARTLQLGHRLCIPDANHSGQERAIQRGCGRRPADEGFWEDCGGLSATRKHRKRSLSPLNTILQEECFVVWHLRGGIVESLHHNVVDKYVCL